MPFTAPFGLLPCPRSLELKSRTSFGTFAHSLKFKYHRDHRFRTTSNSNPSNQRLVFFHHFWATTNHITSHFVSHTSKPKSSSPSFVQILSDSPPSIQGKSPRQQRPGIPPETRVSSRHFGPLQGLQHEGHYSRGVVHDTSLIFFGW